MIAMDLPTTFVQSGPSETTAPQPLDLSSPPATVDTSTGSATITVTVHAGDDLAGVWRIYGGCCGPWGSGDWASWGCYSDPVRVSGTPLDGVCEYTLTVPRYAVTG